MVKTGTDIVKTTPAGEYLTSALNDFDPEQYDSLAAISDGANKLLMLVGTNIHIFMHLTVYVEVKMGKLYSCVYMSSFYKFDHSIIFCGDWISLRKPFGSLLAFFCALLSIPCSALVGLLPPLMNTVGNI